MVLPDLPGAELIEAGLADLRVGQLSPIALAICALRKRLVAVGLDVAPATLTDFPELLMYRALGNAGESNPHSAMNAILRRLDAYASAAEARKFRSEPSRIRE